MQQPNKISGIRKYPRGFSEEEIALILQQILKCKDYWKGTPTKRFTNGHKLSDWGKFFKFRDFTLIATCYALALRPKEACELRFSDFDWKHSLVRIRGETNKTKKDSPPIPVPKSLLKIYAEYFKFPRRRFWRGGKYLFPSFENEHISPSRLKDIMREKVLKPLGLWEAPEGSISGCRTLYKLRHSRAHHIRKRQRKKYGYVDIVSIANFLRHSDIRNTMIYAIGDEDDEEMENLRRQTEL